MLKAKFYLILVLLIAFCLVSWFSYKASFPSESEIEASRVPIKVVSEEVFKDPAVAKIKNFTQFGQLPIVLDKSQQGKDNPFSP